MLVLYYDLAANHSVIVFLLALQPGLSHYLYIPIANTFSS